MDHDDRLCRFSLIADDRTRSPAARFIALRKCAMEADETLTDIWQILRTSKRAKQKFEKASPFNRARVEQLDRQIDWWESYRENVKQAQSVFGRCLIDVGRELDAALTFDQLCDLLEVNATERDELRASTITEKRDFMTIASAFGYEHSAMHRNEHWMRGAVYWAIQEEIQRVMFDTPEGLQASDRIFKELFKPGNPFHGVPTYFRQPDGTFARKSADLTVHDENGSHVVERPIGR